MVFVDHVPGLIVKSNGTVIERWSAINLNKGVFDAVTLNSWYLY